MGKLKRIRGTVVKQKTHFYPVFLQLQSRSQAGKLRVGDSEVLRPHAHIHSSNVQNSQKAVAARVSVGR